MIDCENNTAVIAVQELCEKLNQIAKEHVRVNHTVLYNLNLFRVFKYTELDSFIRIEYTSLGDTSVWGFVDAYGDIYKAKSWSQPSTRVRGNIHSRTDYSHYSCVD